MLKAIIIISILLITQSIFAAEPTAQLVCEICKPAIAPTCGPTESDLLIRQSLLKCKKEIDNIKKETYIQIKQMYELNVRATAVVDAYDDKFLEMVNMNNELKYKLKLRERRLKDIEDQSWYEHPAFVIPITAIITLSIVLGVGYGTGAIK